MTDLNIMLSWLEHDVLGEAGETFYWAIRKCLRCAFSHKSNDLGEDGLSAEVYSEVVEPLEAVLRQFPVQAINTV